MIHIHSEVWGARMSAHIGEEGYEISLPEWSGRQSDVSQIDAVIRFLQTVKKAATPADWLAPVNEAQPPVSSSLIKQAVDEALAEEDYEEGCGCGGDPYCPTCFPVEKADLSWLEPATDEELEGQSSNSGDLFDDYDDDEVDYDYVIWDEDEPADDGSNHASRDPLSGKCYCPYCNSECAPDVCNGCHSELTPPAIDTEMRSDLPDEPFF